MVIKVKITSFFILLLGIFTLVQFNPGPGNFRQLSSIEGNEGEFTEKDKRFLRASAIFEAIRSIPSDELDSKLLEEFKLEFESNKGKGDFSLEVMSKAALIKVNHALGDGEAFNKNMKAFFSPETRCLEAKECFFYLNLITQLADEFDLPSMSQVLNKTEGISPFWSLAVTQIQTEKIHFNDIEESRIFEYILKSSLAHMFFAFKLKLDLDPMRDQNLFSADRFSTTKSLMESLDEPSEEGLFLGLGEAASRDEVEISQLVLDPNFSIDKLKVTAQIWKYRNRILNSYLDRFNYKNPRDWFSQSRDDQNILINALKRYSSFEVKVPTRNVLVEIFEQASGQEDWINIFEKQIETINEIVVQYVKERYPAAKQKLKKKSQILDMELDLFLNGQFDQRSFYGFYTEMDYSSKLSLQFMKMSQLQHESIKKGKSVYHGSFDFYHALQNLDSNWLHGQCEVGLYMHKNFPIRQRVSSWQHKDKFLSPYSKKEYLRGFMCNLSQDEFRKSMIHKFALKKALNAAADEFILGKSSTLLSVLGWFGAFRITTKVMGPALAKAAAKKAVLNSKGVTWRTLNKKNIGPWLKGYAFPVFAVEYLASSMTMAVVRSFVATGIDISSGKSTNYAGSFKNYLKTYSIMYLAIPPVGFLMSKAGALLNPFKGMGSGGVTQFVSKVKAPEKVTKYIKGSYDQVKFNIVESVKFMPVLYVYDVIDYFKKDDKTAPSVKEFISRAEGVMTWTMVWQFMNHSVTRRFGPPVKSADQKSQNTRDRDGGGGGADGGGAEGI